jgi:hypothetical protein
MLTTDRFFWIRVLNVDFVKVINTLSAAVAVPLFALSALVSLRRLLALRSHELCLGTIWMAR